MIDKQTAELDWAKVDQYQRTRRATLTDSDLRVIAAAADVLKVYGIWAASHAYDAGIGLALRGLPNAGADAMACAGIVWEAEKVARQHAAPVLLPGENAAAIAATANNATTGAELPSFV